MLSALPPIALDPFFWLSGGSVLALSLLYWRSLRRSRRIAQELLAVRKDLNESQRITGVGNWTLDLVSGHLAWSDQVFRLFEIDQDRFAASYEAFLKAIHPDDRKMVDQAYNDSLQSRMPYEITHRLRMDDGRIKWVIEKCRSDFDAAGKPLRSIGTVQDITERKLAEAETRIAAVAFESQEAMMITDASQKILRVNQAFTKITGYSPAELVGQTPRMLQSGMHGRDFYRAMWECIKQTGSWSGEVWDRRKDGSIYPKWLTISAVCDEDATVTHYVGSHFDITDNKKASEAIERLAFYDQLTELPNRTLLLDRLKQCMATSLRSGSYGALLFLDIDHFKTLNDTLGHDTGDQLLKQAARRLSRCLRVGDTVARFGGDEFVLILAGLSQQAEEAATEVEAIADKLRAALDQPFQLGDTVYQSSASLGATLFGTAPNTVDDLMKQADLAMYKAKASGRNALRFFDPDMEATVKKHAMLATDLRQALEKCQFLLHYQIQVQDEAQLIGAEVLVRWQHPERGMVSPADFIPLAEETGLILPLGYWILETACRQLAKWARHPDWSALTISVNVSAYQIRQPDFVEQALKIIDATGANPERLKLELTESLLVENVEEIIRKMHALKERGVGFSLDDFGTGYSSLSYLKRLPLDQLKIDQSFVRDVLTDPNDAAIARTVIALAHSLGLGVIAEGVETNEQKDFLRSADCHAYQGYLFSRPLPLTEFESFLEKSGTVLQ